jgi:hypothetical protein
MIAATITPAAALSTPANSATVLLFAAGLASVPLDDEFEFGDSETNGGPIVDEENGDCIEGIVGFVTADGNPEDRDVARGVGIAGNGDKGVPGISNISTIL